MFKVRPTVGPALRAGKPRSLASITLAAAFAEIIIVQNWFEELRRLVPTN